MALKYEAYYCSFFLSFPREAETTDDVFKAMCRHIEYSTNEGSIRPSITVFAERNPANARDKFRIWNRQLLNHGGYEMPDGSVIGDRAMVPFTKVRRKGHSHC